MLRNIVSPTLKISESVSPYNAKLTVVHYSKQADPLDPPSGPCYFVIERSNEIPFLLYEGKYDDSKPCLGDYEQEITWINATTIQTGGSVFHLPSDF